MKKPLKVLSATGLAAIMMSSALTPVAVAAEETPNFNATEEVVFEKDGKLVKVDFESYKKVKRGEIPWAIEAKLLYIKTSEDEFYLLEDFKSAKRATEGDPEAAIELLKDRAKDITPAQGIIQKDGSLKVEDESSEDRLNETFFYNAA